MGLIHVIIPVRRVNVPPFDFLTRSFITIIVHIYIPIFLLRVLVHSYQCYVSREFMEILSRLTLLVEKCVRD